MEYTVDREAKKLLYIIIAGFCLSGIFVIYDAITRDSGFNIFFSLVWLVGVSFVMYYILRQPTKIELSIEKNEINFSNIFKKWSLNISYLKEVKVSNQILSFQFDSIKVSMHHQITGLHSLINELKKMNPNIKIKGC